MILSFISLPGSSVEWGFLNMPLQLNVGLPLCLEPGIRSSICLCLKGSLVPWPGEMPPLGSQAAINVVTTLYCLFGLEGATKQRRGPAGAILLISSEPLTMAGP